MTTFQEKVLSRMQSLGILESDLIEKFILGSGSGGQKINKTSSCVYLKHIPSGLEVKCQRERSREINRWAARKELCDKIEERLLGEQSRKRQAIEKLRRQKRKRSKRAQQKVVAAKRHHSAKKNLRSSITET